MYHIKKLLRPYSTVFPLTKSASALYAVYSSAAAAAVNNYDYSHLINFKQQSHWYSNYVHLWWTLHTAKNKNRNNHEHTFHLKPDSNLYNVAISVYTVYEWKLHEWTYHCRKIYLRYDKKFCSVSIAPRIHLLHLYSFAKYINL